MFEGFRDTEATDRVFDPRTAWDEAALRRRLGIAGVLPPFPQQPGAAARGGGRWGLTGATGWWGRHAGRAGLRADPLMEWVVPVRARSPEEARARVQAAWAPTRKLQQEAHAGRWWARTHVRPIQDLASGAPLAPEALQGVIHAAASVSLAATLDEAWNHNVVGTQRAWNWAHASGAARFDHVSSLSVWASGRTPPGAVHEDDALERAVALCGGYAASKWAAEAWLAVAAQESRSPVLAIHRLGLVGYSEEEGWAPCDPLAATVLAWHRWGRPAWIRPLESEAVDWSPVARTVEGVLAAIRLGSAGPFHWAAEFPLPAAAWVRLLERWCGGASGVWPRTPEGRPAHRAFGRWSCPNAWRRLWWCDAFQSDRHRFGAARAAALIPRWTANEGDVERALVDGFWRARPEVLDVQTGIVGS